MEKAKNKDSKLDKLRSWVESEGGKWAIGFILVVILIIAKGLT
jgi:predicted negative regulator of RcsB-dependent stress response